MYGLIVPTMKQFPCMNMNGPSMGHVYLLKQELDKMNILRQL